MDKNLMIFEGKQVEVFEFSGDVLFNPYDVGRCLDMSEATVRDHVRKFNDKQVKKLTNKAVLDAGLTNIRKLNNAGENFLKEAGVYKLAFKSHKESAERFQDWVTDIVLPSIRKTGGYIPVSEDEDDATIMARALLVAQKTIDNKNKELEAKTKELEDKNRFINQIAESRNSLLVREVAKIISKSDSNILIGEKRLYEKLREWGWVHYKGTEPKQYALDRGYLEVKEGTVTNQSGTFTYYTTKVTGKGQKRILEKLLKEQSEKNKQLKIDI
ncbi:MAG: phage antirepressor KilAC domain-containing protein [Clostridia bacterium]|jgi:anti-repressor protein